MMRATSGWGAPTPGVGSSVGAGVGEGGPLPPEGRIMVRALRLKRDATDTSEFESTAVDSKGDFLIENLAPDTYEVEVFANVPAREGMRRVSAKQTVSTSVGSPGYVSLSLDIGGKGSDE